MLIFSPSLGRGNLMIISHLYKTKNLLPNNSTRDFCITIGTSRLLFFYRLLDLPNTALAKHSIYPFIEQASTQAQIHHIITAADMAHKGHIGEHLCL